MLARHGSVTVGKTLSDAFAKLEKLERSAEILIAAQSLGGAKPFSRDRLEELHGLRGFYGVSGRALPCVDGLDDGRRPDDQEARSVRSIEWEDGRLILLDQTQLPNHVVREEQTSVEQVWDSIKKLKVRGAPAIGVAGAYGLVVAMRENTALEREPFLAALRDAAAYLSSSRPTAVNLSWAVNRVVAAAQRSGASSGAELLELITAEARHIHEEDIELCRSIGVHGVPLIQDGMGILTHCNAGRLATSDYGTATAPMYLAHERGVSFSVYSDESRPLLQGSRLTAWELQQAGIDVYTITDNMAAAMMQQGLIHLVIVGTDRVAANGDVANKIGTLGVAILAKHFNIPFYVACPSSTVDLGTETGREIEIEERDAEEVTSFGARRTAPVGIKVRNPAFDVTPHELVTALITDRGIVRPPYGQTLRELFGAK
ncbi:MAG: S-methyl-5-thioribose-1-phosphate isomerase [Spirochaetaceae bacterium]|nr:MAG: S-methyl-5-thioribose-1-phosphate isomerase [Spirochaetaceae bacterium]